MAAAPVSAINGDPRIWGSRWTHKALAATVSTPNGRGIAQFLTGDPYNGLAIGRDVVINAPDKAKYDEFLLDLKALADEAGFTHRLGAMA